MTINIVKTDLRTSASKLKASRNSNYVVLRIGNEIAIVILERHINIRNVSRISVNVETKRPIHKVCMDMQLGKGYRPTTNISRSYPLQIIEDINDNRVLPVYKMA